MLEKDTGKKLYYKFIFYFITGVFSVAFFTLLLLTNGYSMRGLLYAQRDQTFMDFFNSMLSTIGNPYEHYSFYPPFAMMFYKLLLMLVPQATLDKVVTSESSTAFSTDVKLYQQLYFPFIIYALLSLTMLFFAIKSAKKGSVGEVSAFIFLTMLSAPMLFMYERANNLIIPLALLLFFIANKDSGKRWQRELAIVALALATAFKIYPAVFALMLVHERRFKDVLKTGLYTALLTVPPVFIFFGGFDSIKMIAENLLIYDGKHSLEIGSQLNFAKMIIFPLTNSRLSNDTLLAAGGFFKVVLTVFAAIGAVFAKKEWQRAALCCAIIYGYQATCTTYLLALFIIPIILLLDGEHEQTPVGTASIVLMTLTQALLISINPLTREFSRDLITKITSYAVLLLTVILTVRGCLDCVSTLSEALKLKKGFIFGALAAIFAGTCFITLFIGDDSLLRLIDPGVFPDGTVKNLAFVGILIVLVAVLLLIRYTVVTKREKAGKSE